MICLSPHVRSANNHSRNIHSDDIIAEYADVLCVEIPPRIARQMSDLRLLKVCAQIGNTVLLKLIRVSD
jgi:3-deoxy-D-arabino-heptulosonate 7-phosphate (DAHP) synthase